MPPPRLFVIATPDNGVLRRWLEITRLPQKGCLEVLVSRRIRISLDDWLPAAIVFAPKVQGGTSNTRMIARVFTPSFQRTVLRLRNTAAARIHCLTRIPPIWLTSMCCYRSNRQLHQSENPLGNRTEPGQTIRPPLSKKDHRNVATRDRKFRDYLLGDRSG